MRRFVAGMVLILLALVVPPATGQTGPVICDPGECFGWSPRSAQVVESAGEIVLTYTSYEPGRVVYYTSDGDCSRYPLDPSDCGRPQARAGEDYVAVRGEWIFTEAGSRTIRIPVIDDDLAEPEEAFTVNASQYDDVAEQTVWDNATIRIGDDDPGSGSDAPPATVTPAGDRPSGSSTVDAPPPAPVRAPGAPGTTTVVSLPPDLEVALPSGELEPGPGFELMTERDPEPPPERDDRSGGSASWLAFALGTTALGSGGVVWLRRQRRWSPTRS